MPYALCPLIKRAPHVTEKGYIVFPCLRLVCRFVVRPESSIIQANPLLT